MPSPRASQADHHPLAEVIASAGLAVALIAVAFGGEAGTQLSRSTPVLICVAIGGGLACAAGILLAPGRPRGLIPVALFGLLVAVTALSIDWSVAPDASWIEANRTFAYAAAFAGAVVIANVFPDATRLVAYALLLAVAGVVAYALASRVWPSSLADLEIYARIGQPYGYWNAVGATAALGAPLCLWLGSRRDGPPALRAAAFPLMGLLLLALVLTYSRSSLLAAILATAAWLALVPLRLRSLALLAAAGALSVPVLVWALSKPAFTEDGVPSSAREDVAATFGLLILAMATALYVAGWFISRAQERAELTPETRVKLGRGIAAGAVVLSLVALVVAGDSLSDRWHELTDESSVIAGGPERLGSASSSRSRYWGQALDVFEDHPVEGAGAGSFGTAALRYRKTPQIARHAHGYVPQTMADLGLIGLAVTLALLAAWLAAARIGIRGSEPALALFLAVLAYGVQSALDWTWIVPGPTVMALVAAGWVAGRTARLGSGPPPMTRTRVALAGGLVVVSLVGAWSIWQPERADSRAEDALELAADGETEGALDAARDAQRIDPLAIKPLFAEGAVLQRAGRIAEAHHVFLEAAADHAEDPQAWLRLGNFELDELGRPDLALAAFERAQDLDPASEAVAKALDEAAE